MWNSRWVQLQNTNQKDISLDNPIVFPEADIRRILLDLHLWLSHTSSSEASVSWKCEKLLHLIEKMNSCCPPAISSNRLRNIAIAISVLKMKRLPFEKAAGVQGWSFDDEACDAPHFKS